MLKIVLTTILSIFILDTAYCLGSTNELVIYANDSFLSNWGPGPSLQKSFEHFYRCKIRWVAAADGAAIIARLKLEGRRSKADIVIGIDDALTEAAERLDFFSDLDLKSKNQIEATPIATINRSKKFLAYDYGYYAFMFDTQAKTADGRPMPKPANFAQLLTDNNFKKKILVQDPRTSATGMGLILWLRSIYSKDSPQKMKLLRQQILKVSKGWSESYSLFTKGEAPFVLSYTTSEAYHRSVEKTDRYQALIFPEGHYIAYETAGILKTTKNMTLAKKFLEFLLRPDSQKIIAEKNWMYPVRPPTTGLPNAFNEIKVPEKTLHIPAKIVESKRQEWVEQWNKSFQK
jgi:thiamine transport system substrate-binding protein